MGVALTAGGRGLGYKGLHYASLYVHYVLIIVEVLYALIRSLRLFGFRSVADVMFQLWSCLKTELLTDH